MDRHECTHFGDGRLCPRGIVFSSPMNAVQLRNIDLNLLIVFDAIYNERSIAAASARLSLSQSAISHALGRLRRTLDDELFIRSSGGMRPTPRAVELALPVQHALARLETALAGEAFHPETSSRTFIIAASDFACSTLIPPLIERTAQGASRIGFWIIPANRSDWVRLLDEGRIDLAIAWFAVVPERFGRTRLLREDYVFVARQQHPLAGKVASDEDVLNFRQVVVNYLGNDDGVVDGFLPERGLARRVHMELVALEAPQRVGRSAQVALRLPHFWCVPQILARTDMVAGIPRRLAVQFHDRFGLVVIEPAETLRPVAVEAIWHRSAERDRGVQWLRDQIAGAASDVGRHPTGTD